MSVAAEYQINAEVLKVLRLRYVGKKYIHPILIGLIKFIMQIKGRGIINIVDSVDGDICAVYFEIGRLVVHQMNIGKGIYFIFIHLIRIVISRDNVGVSNLRKLRYQADGGVNLFDAILSIHIAEDKYQIGTLCLDKLGYFPVVLSEFDAVKVGYKSDFYIIFDLVGIYRLLGQPQGIVIKIPQ